MGNLRESVNDIEGEIVRVSRDILDDSAELTTLQAAGYDELIEGVRMVDIQSEEIRGVGEVIEGLERAINERGALVD